MNTFKITTNSAEMLADTVTPVSIYLRLRDVFPNSIMLESSDYHARDNAKSYICCQPFAGIVLDNHTLSLRYPNSSTAIQKPSDGIDLEKEIQEFRAAFLTDHSAQNSSKKDKSQALGLFGYFTFEAVQYMEQIKFSPKPDTGRNIPLLQYHFYKYVIAIDHFHNELVIYEHCIGEEASALDKVKFIIENRNLPTYAFETKGEEQTNLKDEEFVALVQQMKAHIFQGDVFQIVPSRAFSQSFTGDEFNVYRALRSVNPSPYLFYFDYGNFKLFGSSPEAQLIIKKNEASVFPIAGTFRRSGQIDEDLAMAEKLQADPKETAEHIMLVDLARNDLSKNCKDVNVKSYKEAQFYSHVIHLVSQIVGKVPKDVDSFKVLSDTYPAGTLSGAPKYKALELIDKYEGTQRGFYSGAIGYMGLDQEFNHAIMIRSFMSRENKLHYQAGAGVVADSDPQMELKEVDNKIAALRKALKLAEQIR